MSEKKQGKFYQAIGRRKEATTTVRLFAGKGESTVNGTPVSKYFPIDSFQAKLVLPYRATGTEDKFYFVARAEGGGKVGQLDAIVLGISRALVLFNGDLRFEYCGRLRAFLRKYFFLSFSRGLRVIKPASRNGLRRSTLKRTRAREIPKTIASN